ncbi:MAG: efflux RND transporter periplasmic adaptor subunit, partial [Akkermansia sp.]|nr:efflux RND transporter periplasmic adaptor subunit [Akkermansia sp.]
MGIVLPACNNEKDSTLQAENVGIKVFYIKKQTVTDTGDWFGYLRGKNDTDIHPRVSGFLISQEYKDGQFVKKGDILFKIDPELFEAELAQAKANLQAAEASLTSAKASCEQYRRDVERYEQLIKTSAVSEKQLTDARHQLRAAEAKVKSCEASIEQNKASVDKAQINLDYTIVRAPYDGVVSTALASRGDLVGESTKLANISAINPIRVDFSLNSDTLVNSFRKYGKVQSAKKDASLTSPNFDLILEDGSTHPYKGTLLSMESKVATTGLIDVEGEIENPDMLLRSGMSVRVRIPLATKEALLVPQEAIRTVLRNNFIIVVDKNSIPHTVPVIPDGSYDVTITEEDGYTSTQKLVAIKAYSRPLEDYFREFGYEDAAQVPVVADKENGVRAMNISSANSRMAKGDTSPRGTIKQEKFTFRRTLTATEKAALEQAKAPAKAATNVAASLPPFPVEVMPLVKQDVSMQNEWFGTLRGQEETDIRPKVSGFILSQNFRNGTLVKKGDVLFTIDPAPYRAALAEAQANLLSAQAALEQAQAKLDMSRSDHER